MLALTAAYNWLPADMTATPGGARIGREGRVGKRLLN